MRVRVRLNLPHASEGRWQKPGVTSGGLVDLGLVVPGEAGRTDVRNLICDAKSAP